MTRVPISEVHEDLYIPWIATFNYYYMEDLRLLWDLPKNYLHNIAFVSKIMSDSAVAMRLIVSILDEAA